MKIFSKNGNGARKNKLARKNRARILQLSKIGLVMALIAIGLIALWITTFSLPNINNFEERRVAQSTKIFDRTGEIVLYDIHGDVKRTVVALDEVSENLVKATIAVEDKDFYKHNGVQISAIARAIINNLRSGNILGGQGGSTITQQVIKNALLTTDKKISRKIKEWVLAPRLEKILTKDEILQIYLNEVPYGGNVYGIEEAALRFFGKQARDLSLAESAYLAALPQAPTYYSPYGNNIDDLDVRKNYVLDQMFKAGFIGEGEMNEAKNTQVDFQKQEEFGIRAPHFVMFIREQLEKEFGRDVVEEGGLRVITTLNWEMQERAEEIVHRHVLGDEGFAGIEERYNASNGSIVATDPQSGDILVMVGSRDYFDEEIDGNFNVATAERQPGSSFKPFVYAEAFNKGYKPDTVVFDLPTEFSAVCASGGPCYNPVNYDDAFRGPISLRDALAQSINVPAVKVLYLAGLRDALNLAKKMGIGTLTNPDQYGLTLVLGGGEVRPIDMASAYGVFAADGIKYPQRSILRIEDREGNILFDNEDNRPDRVLSENTARMISDVLSDNVARTPTFGTASPLFFPGYEVAAKTGTTNDYRDTWIVGYTPNISVAAWAGNNDNSPMEKRTAGFIVSPMWNEFMQFVLEKVERASFMRPITENSSNKAIINGYWRGEKTDFIEGDSGNKEIVVTGGGGGIHSILHWVNKEDPLGPTPSNPNTDPQYHLWERSVRDWVKRQNISEDVDITDIDEITGASFKITNPIDGSGYFSDGRLVVVVKFSDNRDIIDGQVFVNNVNIGQIEPSTQSYLFIPNEISLIKGMNNALRVVVTDQFGNTFEDSISFNTI